MQEIFGKFSKKASTNDNNTGGSLIAGATSLLRLLYRVLVDKQSDDE